MDHSESTLQDFTDRMQDTYEENSILDEICNVVSYEESRHGDLGYVQIGKRIWLPFDFITTTIEITNAQRLLRSVTQGERRFFVNHLNEFSLEQVTPSAESDGLSIGTVRSAAARINDPDHIFVPNIDRYADQHRQWAEMDRLSYDGGEFLDINGGIELHWIPEDWGYEDIHLVNSERIDVVQKTYEDAPLPKGMDVQRECDHLSSGERLMIYFGEVDENPDDDFDKKVDFFYRVILSKPRPSPGSVFRIEAPEDIA